MKTHYLTITDNSISMLSIRRKDNMVSVRMHWMFLNAGDDVIREMSSLIKTGKGWTTPHIRKFMSTF